MSVAIPDEWLGGAPAEPAAPVRPKLGFLDLLAGSFGNGPDRLGAYNQQLEDAPKIKLVSAQTESALEQARERRAAAAAQERTNTQRELLRSRAEANGGTPSVLDMLEADVGGNWQQLQGGELGRQELGFRGTLGDPNAVVADQIAAQQGVQGKVAERYYQPAPGLLSDFRDPAQAPVTTEMGKSQLAVDQAQIRNYDEKPAAAGGAGVPGAPLFKTSAGIAYMSTDAGKTWTAVGDPANVAANAAARAGGAATGAKQASLPAQLNAINEMRTVAGNLRLAPGRGVIYGKSGLLNPVTTRLGGDGANAETIRQQLGSRGFLASIQQMRGLGQLSNAEGLKVESALQRLTNTSLPDTEFDTAYAELLTSLDNLERVAQQEAGAVPNVLAPGGSPRSFNSEAEAIAAGVKPGDRVIIGGVPGTWE